MDSAIGLSSRHSLRETASRLAKRLKGYPCGPGYMCRCPAHADRSPSLSIRIGDKALLFKCFAGCDTLDVLRELRTLDFRSFDLSIADGVRQDSSGRQAWLRERVRELWDQARPIDGTVAETYLARRGLSLQAEGLRFHPRTPLGPKGSAIYRPALLAGLHDSGRLVAVQRGFFDEGKAQLATDLGNPRRLLGRPRGGAVVLSPASDVLGLAEGVETALSASVLLGIPVWATLGSERLPHIAIPDRVTRLIILPDNDRAGRIGAGRAMTAHVREGRLVEARWPPSAYNDWNDVLKAGNPRASVAD